MINPLSPITYGHSYSSGSMGAIARYSQTQLLIADAFKEQQYWLSVYNYAQQFGIKGTTIQDILTQLQRVQEKLNGLQQITSPSAEGYLQFVNTENNKRGNVFNS